MDVQHAGENQKQKSQEIGERWSSGLSYRSYLLLRRKNVIQKQVRQNDPKLAKLLINSLSAQL